MYPRWLVAVAAVLLMLPLLQNACSAIIPAKSSLESRGSGTGNPVRTEVDLGDVNSQVFSFEVCIASIRATTEAGTIVEPPMIATMLLISKTESHIPELSMPGRYTDIELISGPACSANGRNPNFKLVNDHGTFEGPFVDADGFGGLKFIARSGPVEIGPGYTVNFDFKTAAGLLTEVQSTNSFLLALSTIAPDSGGLASISPSQASITLRATPASVGPSEVITVQWSTPVGQNGISDQIGLVAADGTVLSYSANTEGLQIGSRSMVATGFGPATLNLRPGDYRFIYIRGDGVTVAQAPFTVRQ